MTPSRGDVDRLLDQALDLTPGERSAFLDQACAAEVELRAEVERVLAAAQAARLLDLPAPDFVPAVARSGAPGPADLAATGATLFGPYRVLEELGRGGMGTVYLAERVDGQFEQRVALKLNQRGIDSEEIQRRFLAERQILARLQHPNIARLVDGGITVWGQPWFAMEYVDGEPITTYCDGCRLGVSGRLRLFGEVCRAVRHAHQSLVVHRDLKPSNILVTADGAVKLLDFGIAKLLNQEPGNQEALTGVDIRMMTPAYAAPEQIRGDQITTATDVYALGGVLYELLTGRCAQRFERFTPADVERVVCHTDPAPPSTAVESDRWDHARLRRQLRGDLDTIVLKALRKEPSRRYPSAEAFLADLQRYEAGLPVQARPDSAGYRARKFVIRHRVGVAATTALVMALVTGLVGTIWQARTASQEAAKAREVKEFVKELFKGVRPEEARGKDISARELLDRGTRRVDSALAGQPAVQLELIHFLGDVNLDLGFYERGDSLLERAAQLAGRLYGSRSPQLAAELTARAEAVWFNGEYDRADSMLKLALEIYGRSRSRDERALGEALSNRATVLGAKGEYAPSESLFREVVGITRRVYGPGHLEMALDLSNLGLARWRMGDLEGADSALRASLSIRRRSLDPGHPSVLLSMHNLATNLNAQGKLEEAERMEREVLAKRRALYPQGHPDIAVALQMLYRIVAARGRYEEAEAMAQEALAIRRQWLGPDHAQTLEALANVGFATYLTGDLATAESATREALAGYRRDLGDEHPTTLTIVQNLGVILRDEGKYAEAAPALGEALTGRRRVLGDSSPEVAQTLRHLGDMLHRAGRMPDAERVLRNALAIDRAVLPAAHPATAEVLTALGMTLVDLRRAAAAEPLLREALATRRAKHGAGEPRTLETASALGACLVSLGRYQEAEPLLSESYEKLRASPYGRRQLPDAVRHLIAYHKARGEPARAARYTRELARMDTRRQ